VAPTLHNYYQPSHQLLPT